MTAISGGGASGPLLKLPVPRAAAGHGAPMQTTPGGLTLLPTSLANQGAQLLPTSLAQGGAQMYSPSIAATLAGTQYNQAIQDAQQNLAQITSGAGQSMQNVEGWWNQILGAQQGAASRDQTLGQSVAGAEASNNAGILASLGGSADPAASSVATAGQDNQGTLAAINAINGEYNANLSPLLHLGAAGAEGQQQNANAQNISKAMQNVNDLIAQKGNAQAQDQYQIMQANNQIRDTQHQRLIDIMQGNNTVRNDHVSNLEGIVGANNATINNQDQLTHQQQTDARSYALQLASLHDTEKQNKLGALLAVGYDPSTGSLTPQAAQEISQITGIDPKALAGTSASGAASIIGHTVASAKTVYTSSQPSSSLSNTYHYIVDHNGNPVLKGGQLQPTKGYAVDPKNPNAVVAVPKLTHSTGALTDHEITDMVNSWYTGKTSTVRVPARTPDGKVVTNTDGSVKYTSESGTAGNLQYGDALKRAQGLPPRDRAAAIHQVNTLYAPGSRGRPWLTPHQQTLLAKNGPQVDPKTGQVTGGVGRKDVAMVNGHAVLDPSQYALLKAHNSLPAGQLTQEGFYVITGGGNA